jgi:hypothetical protein
VSTEHQQNNMSRLPCPNPQLEGLRPRHPVHIAEPRLFKYGLGCPFLPPHAAAPHLWPQNARHWELEEAWPDPDFAMTPKHQYLYAGYDADMLSRFKVTDGFNEKPYPAFMYRCVAHSVTWVNAE